MSKNLSAMWPDNVPENLWNYERALVGLGSTRIFPMSNYSISRETMWYFLIGLVVVWLYSWNRYNRRSYDPGPFDYRVLRELQPSQMRDNLLMHRGFILYAIALSLIYTIFTFFGGIILKILQPIPAIGPTGITPEQLNHPQWPLIVAFGLAGLTQLIGPLDGLEKMLRGHIHRSLGIPISIKEYTRQLIATQLRNLTAEAQRDYPESGMTGPVEGAIAQLSSGHVGQLHHWARQEIAQTYGVEDVLGRLILLWRMIDSLYSPSWPRENVRDEMRALLARQLHEGRAAALYLSDLLSTKQADDAGQTSDGDGDSGTPTPVRTRQEQQLIAAIESMDRHLYEIAAIHAVYAQRDRDYDDIQVASVRAAMKEVFQDEVYGPSLRQLTCAAAVLFVGYCIALTWLNQPTLNTMVSTPWTVGLNAGYETFRNLCIYVFPVLFAIYATAPNGDSGNRGVAAPGHVMAAGLWAALAGAILMVFVATLYVWLIASDANDFREKLIGDMDKRQIPFILWFMYVVPVIGLIAAGVVAARRVHSDEGHFTAMTMVALSAAGSVYVMDLLQSGARDHRLSDMFIDMVAAFLSVIFLCQSNKAGRLPRSADKGAAPLLAQDQRFALGMMLVVLVLAFPAYAQQQPATDTAPRTVNLGFRNDVAPFSAFVGRGAEARYRGYLVDLCHEIFAGSRAYRVNIVSVTVDDRFNQMRSAESAVPVGERVDVLCDPVTIRYSGDDDRWKYGIFSPIVFATGVTYVERNVAASQPSNVMGYIETSTARDVVADFEEKARAADPPAISAATDADAPKVAEPTGGFWRRLSTSRSGAQANASNVRRRSFTDHEGLVEWFCDDKGDKGDTSKVEKRYYFGDREIIMARVRAKPNCQATPHAQSYTYEPYALLIDKSDPDLVQFVQRRVYEIFSDQMKVRALFAAHFPDYQMTSSLAYLFLLNGVDEDRPPGR